MADFKRLVKAWGEWIEAEPKNIFDKIKGTQRANERQRDIEYLLQQLDIDNELSRLGEPDGRRSL